MDNEHRPVSEINITPLADVMVVLMIVFMVSAPFIVPRGKEIHLPKVQEFQTLKTESNVLKIFDDGTLEFNGIGVNSEEYLTMLESIVSTATEPVNLFIRGDKSVHYGAIVNAMDLAKIAGVDRIGLVSDIEETDVPLVEETIES